MCHIVALSFARGRSGEATKPASHERRASIQAAFASTRRTPCPPDTVYTYRVIAEACLAPRANCPICDFRRIAHRGAEAAELFVIALRMTTNRPGPGTSNQSIWFLRPAGEKYIVEPFEPGHRNHFRFAEATPRPGGAAPGTSPDAAAGRRLLKAPRRKTVTARNCNYVIRAP